MSFTNAQLSNGGQTPHYLFSYDDTFSDADGWTRTSRVMFLCEDDFNVMQAWFKGVGFQFSFPIKVQIANASGGASWNDPPNISLPFGYNPTVTISPGPGATSNLIRYLLVSEVTEMFMASQNKGWYESSGLFSGADEGSKGEALSRFLGYQFTLARSINERYGSYEVVWMWLNSPGRPRYVNNNPDDHNPDVITGCTTAFLYYLHGQLGYSIPAIIAAAGSTLGDVYKNLTGKDDGEESFMSLVNTYYPPGITYHPIGDAIFPVANLTLMASTQLQSGSSITESIVGLDNLAPAEIVVSLSSDSPTILSVSPNVTVQPGGRNISVNISAAPITGPVQLVGIHATYAGKTLSSTVKILPRPSILEGFVKDSSLKPIAQANVDLSANAPITPIVGNSWHLETGANGLYQTTAITPQFYQAEVSAAGYVPAHETVTVNVGVPVTTLNFVLTASLPYTVKGMVSSQGGGALAGATVSLRVTSPAEGGGGTITDANGSYVITDNPNIYTGEYTLTASMAGFMSSSVTFTIPNGATVIKNLVLAALGSLWGTVRDTTGKPIAGAIVAVGTVSSRSDSTGAYSLAGLNPVPTEVSASAFGYDPAQMQLVIGAGAHVAHDIAMTPASAKLTGTVFSAADILPLSGASVVLVGVGTSDTDRSGNYTFLQVPAGEHEITVNARRFRPQMASVHVVAHQTVEQNFELQNVHGPSV
jgi:hypothetical protein